MTDYSNHNMVDGACTRCGLIESPFPVPCSNTKMERTDVKNFLNILHFVLVSAEDNHRIELLRALEECSSPPPLKEILATIQSACGPEGE